MSEEEKIRAPLSRPQSSVPPSSSVSTRDIPDGKREVSQIDGALEALSLDDKPKQAEVDLFAYHFWLQRFTRVLSVCKEKNISGKPLEGLQLFILEYGQFNASFTNKELERLQYPKSPFAIMHRHTYIRSTDNWAMEMLRVGYQHSDRNRLFPVFLDSQLFWEELSRYCQVITEKEISADRLRSLCVDKSSSGEFVLEKSLWIRMDDSSTKDKAVECKRTAENKVKSIVLRGVARKNSLPESLIELFQYVLLGDTKGLNQKFNEAKILTELEGLFPDVLKEVKKAFDESNNQLNTPDDLAACDKAWFGKIFGLAKKRKVTFPDTNIKTPENLQNYAKYNREGFSKFLYDVKGSIRLERPSVGQYVGRIDVWISQKIYPIYQEMSKHIVYFFRDTFVGLEAIVFCDYSKMPDFVSGVIGNLGYRVDPLRAIRAILKRFPWLFVDAKQTKEFWGLFKQTTMGSKLSEVEQIGRNIETRVASDPMFYDKKPSDFKKEFHEFSTLVESMSEEDVFKIYGGFIRNYLASYLAFNVKAKSTEFQWIANPEIKEALHKFIQAYKDKNLPLAIWCSQVITDILLLHFNYQDYSRALSNVVRNNYLKEFQPRTVLVTPYAMRSFVRVFQILDVEFTALVCNISVTNQGYFEWLSNLNGLNVKKYSVTFVRSVADIEGSADIIFAEIHPNNFIETRQFAHDLGGLIDKMLDSKWRSKKRTLVIDVTLNALNDKEIKNILNRARPLIDSGALNIILIQSLTKFSQLGLDRRSAGVLVAINNGKDWVASNKRLDLLQQIEKLDPTTTSFFSYFFGLKDLTQQYIDQVNRNVRFVYEQVINQFKGLEVLNHDRFQITVSSDRGACYVALNMAGLLPAVDPTFLLNMDCGEKFSKDLLERFIFPLCEFLKFRLRERMTIGFPLCSINFAFDSLRFTVGLEPENQLIQYAEVLAYVAFVLNRTRDEKLFFERDGQGNYSLRINYFKEKVEQFKAMTPGRNSPFKFSFEGVGGGNGYRSPLDEEERQLERRVKLCNGYVQLSREIPNPFDSGRTTTFSDYTASTIYVPIRGIGNIPLSDPRITMQQKRMLVACLTRYVRSGQINHQNVNLQFGNPSPGYATPSTVSFPSAEILNDWNEPCVYGPFDAGNAKKKVNFYLFQKEISAIDPESGDDIFYEEEIYIKQGNIILKLADMPISDREFFFREGAYDKKPFPATLFGLSSRSEPNRISPLKGGRTRIEMYEGYMVIERDFLCCMVQGVNIYNRYLNEKVTCYEVDFWSEKDPTFARFLRLMTVIYIKDKWQRVAFQARDRRFTHFIFNVTQKDGQILFQEALDRVLSQKRQLKKIFDNPLKQQLPGQYNFGPSAPAWSTALPESVGWVDNTSLIEQARKILTTPRAAADIKAGDTSDIRYVETNKAGDLPASIRFLSDSISTRPIGFSAASMEDDLEMSPPAPEAKHGGEQKIAGPDPFNRELMEDDSPVTTYNWGTGIPSSGVLETASMFAFFSQSSFTSLSSSSSTSMPDDHSLLRTTSNPEFFQPASSLPLREVKHAVAEQKSLPSQKAQEKLEALETLVDTLFPPVSDRGGSVGRSKYLRELLPFQRRRDELIPADLPSLEVIEAMLLTEQAQSLASLGIT